MRKTYIIACCMTLCMYGKFNTLYAQNSNTKKDVSIQLYSVRSLLNDINKSGKASEQYTDVLSKLANMGYTSVETANYNNGLFYGRTPENFKKDIEKSGMKVLSSHCSKNLTDKEIESGDFSESMKWWSMCIKDHKKAGMKYIVFPYLHKPATIKELDAYCKYFNEIGKLCKNEGIMFGYHNHAHEFQKVEDKALMYDYMLENTNPEYVFFQMDVYWVVRGQNSPVDYFNKYPGRFKILHIKDHREIGQSGMVGFDAIFKHLKTAGVQGIVAEIENYSSEDVLKSIEESINYLKEAKFVPNQYTK